MTRVRIILVAALASVAIAGLTISSALAAPSSQGSSNASSGAPLYTLGVHGAAKNGKKFTGRYAIQRFVVAKVNGKRGVYAVGTLKGTFLGKRVSRNNVMLPAKLKGGNGKTSTATKSARAAAPCPILTLVLGPVNLNLLGLQVQLFGGNNPNLPINLNIIANPTGTPGGGLLGDLLCSLNNALSGSGVLSQLSGQLQALSATLNALIGLLGGL
jgi:hypothetical protein